MYLRLLREAFIPTASVHVTIPSSQVHTRDLGAETVGRDLSRIIFHRRSILRSDYLLLGISICPAKATPNVLYAHVGPRTAVCSVTGLFY